MAIGKLATTAFILNQYRVSDRRTGDTVDTGTKLANVWGAPFAYAVGGVVVKGLVSNPVTFAITAAYAEGAIVSDIIDPDEGLDNYVGFTLGGIAGGNNANYVTGDDNNSGYFNVAQNLSTVMTVNQDKINSALKRKALKLAEQEYIDAYWEAKAAANWESMVITYNALTPAQQREIVNANRQNLPYFLR
jgi:hypothetical protein